MPMLYMSMSLDGHIAGPHDNPGAPTTTQATLAATTSFGCTRGSGLIRSPVRSRSQSIRRALANRSSTKSIGPARSCPAATPRNRPNTGAVITTTASRSLCPVTRPPGASVENYPLVTYVADGIASAMEQAKAAAGDRNVLVHGASTAQTALVHGVLDELQIHPHFATASSRSVKTAGRVAIARKRRRRRRRSAATAVSKRLTAYEK
jgi:hypothetical protein